MTYSSKLNPYILYFFLAFFLFIIFPEAFYKMPTEGLDPSWNIALNLAIKYDLVFGKDFLFTYGPLGILNNRLPISIHLWVYLIFDIYFLGLFLYTAKEILKKNLGIGTILYAFFCITMAMYQAQEQWYVFFFLFFVFSFIRGPHKLMYILQAAVISLICFYYKVGAGISLVVIFFIFLTYARLTKKLSLKSYIGTILLYIGVMWLCARFMNVDLRGYLQGSMHLINAYNDSMFRPIQKEYIIFGYGALVIILLLISWVVYRVAVVLIKKEIIKSRDELFIYFVSGMVVFVLFKSGFTRTDTHIYLFFKSICLIASFIYLYSNGNLNKKIAATVCWIALAISYWAVNAIPGSYRPYQRLLNLSFFPIKTGEIENYFQGLKNYNKQLAASAALTSSQNELKTIIGDHSVDVIPTEISKVYFNGLRYNPRPVIQSYSVYDRYLDSVNYQKYMSANAPDFILLRVNSIDNRYAFFDESQTKLALLSRYSIAGEVKGDLILKKNAATGQLQQTEEHESLTASQGAPIIIKKYDGIQFSRVFVEYNFWGKLRRFFFQPPDLKISFTLENGEKHVFRVSKTILEDGVILNKFIDSEQEFQLLMQTYGKLNSNVRKIIINPDSAISGFANNIRIENSFYQFTSKAPEEMSKDSTAAAELLNRYKPQLADTLAAAETEAKPGDIKYGLDYFKTHSQIIRVAGWAFLEKGSNKNIIIKAVLKSGNKVYELPTERTERVDLPAVFGRDDLFNTGFSAAVSKSQLPPGSYQVGIRLYDPAIQKQWVTYLDLQTQISGIYDVEKLNPLTEPFKNKDEIQYTMDSITENEDQALVHGWAFLKNKDSKGTKTNLILQSKSDLFRINTDLIIRKDVIAHFSNPLLGYSGFNVAIPKNKLPKGIYTIGIEKVSADGKERSLAFSDQKIRIGFPDFAAPVVFKGTLPAGDFKLGIDNVKDYAGYITLSGWAVQNINTVQTSTIQVILKSDNSVYVAETEPRLRPDVTTYLKSTLNIDNCGFYVKISKAVLPKGKYQVGIYVSQNGNNGTVKFLEQHIVKE